MNDPFYQGREAYEDGKNLDANPHDPSTDDHEDWEMGFLEAEDEALGVDGP